MLDSLRQEIVYAARALRRRPGFTVLVAATLALGIGANTAIFTVVNAVLLKPLPYEDTGSLVMVWSRWEAFDKTWVSVAEYLDYRDRLESLDDAAAFYSGLRRSLTGDFEPQSFAAAGVTANLFEVFGVEPVAGRTFTAEEDLPNGPAVAMIDEGLWRDLYGAAMGSTSPNASPPAARRPRRTASSSS